MAVYEIGAGAPKYIGISTDTKPTAASPGGLRAPQIGSTFLEEDTGLLYVTYDGTNWAVKKTQLAAGTAAIGKLAANSGVDIGDVDILSIATGSNIIGKVKGLAYQATDEQTIDASLGAHAAGDVVGEDDCCTTLAIVWSFDFTEATAGGYVEIIGALLTNETENQAVQYDLMLNDSAPNASTELRDNAASNFPLKADYDNYLGKISFPQSVAKGSTVTTYTEAYPGDGVSHLPKVIKLATGVTTVKGILVTNTAYTQTAGDKIRITLIYVPY